jgi:serine protease AprX
MNQRHIVRAVLGALLAFASSVAGAHAPGLEAALAAAPPAQPLMVFVRAGTVEAAERATRASGLRLIERWSGIDTVVVAGTPPAIHLLLASNPAGLYVEPNRKARLYLDSAHVASRAALARDPATGLLDKKTGMPYDGTGISIAINDTGIDGTHPMFVENGVSKVVVNLRQACLETGDGCGEWIAMDNTDPDHGHGTAVAGVAAGYERSVASGKVVRGVAPGAKLVGLGQSGYADLVYGFLSGLNWVLEHHGDPCGDGSCPPIRVVSNAWGPLDAETENTYQPESTAVRLSDALVAQGIVVTYAIGNGGLKNAGDGGSGDDNRVLYLAANPTPGVIGVANYDDNDIGDRNFRLYGSSSRALRSDPTTYPDLSAPGTSIRTSLSVTQAGYAEYSATVDDRAYGTVSGTSMASPYISGAAAVLMQARPLLTPAQVEYTLENTAHQFGLPDYVADPRNPDHATSFDRGHGLVDVAAALASILKRKLPAEGAFVADGELNLSFIPLPERATGVISPEGCETEAGAPSGTLAAPAPGGVCHSASHGYLEYNFNALPAEFTSAPLDSAIAVGGMASIVVHIADPLRESASAASVGRFVYRLDVIAADGTATSLSTGETLQGLVDGRNEGAFDVIPVQVPMGARLRLQLLYPGAASSAARMLFGGADYGDAGITLTVGHFDDTKRNSGKAAEAAPEGQGVVVGALSPTAVLVLIGLFAVKRRLGRG